MECNLKHAYLIMAHNQPEVLKKLVILLDDERNDIYIHIDKKMSNFSEEELNCLVKNAKLFWIKRRNVRWGNYSLIQCELNLLREATKKEHQYYHLLSGVDLPLKSQDEIHAFFDRYTGLEFVDEDSLHIDEKYMQRIKYYHFFVRRNGGKTEKIRWKIYRIQEKLQMDRTKKYPEITFSKGSNWFSITHELASYVVQKRKWIKRTFCFSSCGDEIFLQTVVRNSSFVNKMCNHVTMPQIHQIRYIDWKRGNPYTFRMEDYQELKSSSALFARKFDEATDPGIIEKIYQEVKAENDKCKK